jgi:CRISPR/Cas system-associated exonuclease Cas4 (RecB family)
LGKASIFAQPGAVLENEGTRAITAIKAIMNNGALDGSIDGIEHVRFINGTYTLGLDPALISMAQGSTSSTDEDGLAGYAIALIVIAVVGVVAFAAFLVVERKKMRETKETRKALKNRMVSMSFDELERDTMDIPLD